MSLQSVLEDLWQGACKTGSTILQNPMTIPSSQNPASVNETSALSRSSRSASPIPQTRKALEEPSVTAIRDSCSECHYDQSAENSCGGRQAYNAVVEEQALQEDGHKKRSRDESSVDRGRSTLKRQSIPKGPPYERFVCLKPEFQFQILGYDIPAPPGPPPLPQLPNLMFKQLGFLSNDVPPRAPSKDAQNADEVEKDPFVCLYISPQNFVNGELNKASIRDSSGNNALHTCQIFQQHLCGEIPPDPSSPESTVLKFKRKVRGLMAEKIWRQEYRSYRIEIDLFKSRYIANYVNKYRQWEFSLFHRAANNPTTMWLHKRPKNAATLTVKDICTPAIPIDKETKEHLSGRDIESMIEAAKRDFDKLTTEV